MQNYHTKGSGFGSRLSRRGMVVGALALVMLGTAGFAAAGGVEIVRGWFITVEVNGEPVDIDDANIHVETDGDTVTMTIDDLEVPGDAEGGTATVTITAEPGEEGTVIIEEENGETKTIEVQVNSTGGGDPE